MSLRGRLSECNLTRPAPPRPRLPGDFLLPFPPLLPPLGPAVRHSRLLPPGTSGPGSSGPAGKRGSGGGRARTRGERGARAPPPGNAARPGRGALRVGPRRLGGEGPRPRLAFQPASSRCGTPGSAPALPGGEASALLGLEKTVGGVGFPLPAAS